MKIALPRAPSRECDLLLTGIFGVKVTYLEQIRPTFLQYEPDLLPDNCAAGTIILWPKNLSCFAVVPPNAIPMMMRYG